MEEEGLKQFPQAQDTHLQFFMWPYRAWQLCGSHHMQLITKFTTRLVYIPFKDKATGQHLDAAAMPNCCQNSKRVITISILSVLMGQAQSVVWLSQSSGHVLSNTGCRTENPACWYSILQKLKGNLF